MKVSADTLHQLIYNALIFTPGKGEAKKTTTAGEVLFRLTERELLVVATEGYVVLSDRLGDVDIDIPSDAVVDWYVPGETLREYERFCRGQKGETTFTVDVDLDASQTSTDGMYWKGVTRLLAGAGVTEGLLTPSGVFAVGPDRLSKFSRLKPQGDYPLDVKPFHTSLGQQLLYWKYGPTVRGILVPLDREIITEHFIEQPEVLWKG